MFFRKDAIMDEPTVYISIKFIKGLGEADSHLLAARASQTLTEI
jgi:hypothetical protein